MSKMTSYDRYGRLMSDFDKSAYGPCWYYEGQPQTTAFAAPNEGVKLAANLRRLEEENAKLRELVADAWGYINHPADATWTHKKRKEVRDSIADCMRELGIEVES